MWSTLKSIFADEKSASASPRQVQLAAAALLIEVSKADYNTHAEEQLAIVDAIRHSTGIGEDEIAAMLTDAQRASSDSTSLYEFTSLLNSQYSDDQKFELVKTLWRVAAADGEIHKYEDHLIRKIADLIYVPHAQFIRAKLEVLNATTERQ